MTAEELKGWLDTPGGQDFIRRIADELAKRMPQPVVVPYPYPVPQVPQPVYPWQPYWVCSGGTGGTQ